MLWSESATNLCELAFACVNICLVEVVSPYEDFKQLPAVLFAKLHQDLRLNAKDRIVGIAIGDAALALPIVLLIVRP